MTAGEQLTDADRAFREEIEVRTDELVQPLLDALGELEKFARPMTSSTWPRPPSGRLQWPMHCTRTWPRAHARRS